MANSKYSLEENDKYPLIPSWRAFLSVLGLLGACSLYTMRINMGMAIVCMVKDDTKLENNTKINTTVNPCPTDYVNGTKKSPGGWLARRIGGKYVIGTGMFFSCVFNLLTPGAARLHPGLLIALRILCGLAQGIYFPPFLQMWSQWAPPLEKTKLVNMVFVGTNIGSVLTFSVSGYLCEHGFDGGWPSIFYIFGLAGLGWCLSWFVLGASSTEEHRFISEKERKYIMDSIGHKLITKNTKDPTPWLKIFTSGPVLALFVGSFCYAWARYTILTTLPQYMKDVLQFDIKQNGLYNALPYMCMFVITLTSAFIVDWLMQIKLMHITKLRKISTTFGLLVPGCVLLGIGYLTCHKRPLAVALLCVAVGFTGCTRAGVLTNNAEIAPKFTGEVSGLALTIGLLPAVISPLVTSAMTQQGSQEQWRNVFYLSAGFLLVGEVVYLIFGSSEAQSWAIPQSETKAETNITPKSGHTENREIYTVENDIQKL